MGRHEVLSRLPKREQITHTALAISTAITLNLPQENPEFACEQAIVQSTIEQEKAPRLGFTFNPNEARYVGLDPKFAMEEVLKLGFDQVRIAMYPNQPAEQMVDEVKWQVDLADEYNTDVILILGRKAPAWPEEYLPRDAHNETLEKMQAILHVVGDNDRVTLIQVSNEPFLKIGDLHPEDPELLEAMLTLILPYGKPTLLTHFADPLKIRSQVFEEVLAFGDYGGIDTYIETSGGRSSCVSYSDQLRRLDQQAKQAEKPLYVTELQTLPWPDQISLPLPNGETLTIPFSRGKDFDSAEIRKLYRMILLNTDAESIFFWEAVKALKHSLDGNPSTWNEIQQVIETNKKARIALREEVFEEQGTIISFSDDHSSLPLVIETSQ